MAEDSKAASKEAEQPKEAEKSAEPKKPEVGVLTEEQQAIIRAWFDKLKGEGLAPRCPVCSNTNWGSLSHLVSSPVFAGGSIILGGPQYPHFMLACTKCGNIQFINAVMSGVLKLPEGEK